MPPKPGSKNARKRTTQGNSKADNISDDKKIRGASSKEDIASAGKAISVDYSKVEMEKQDHDQQTNKELENTTGTAQATTKPPQGKQKGEHELVEELQKTPKAEGTEQDELAESSNQPDKQPANFMNIRNLVVIGFVLALICILSTWYPAPDPDHAKIFENKLVELQTSFTNQTDRFWRIIKNRGLAHLMNKNPPQLLVLLLAAPPTAHGVVDCLAKKLAEVLHPRHKRMLATIDGTEEKRFAGEKAKKKMDELLTDKFRAGHRVALIHHLELLPPPSPLLFYSYCDDQNAPHKHVAIIFTVHLPAKPDASLSPNEAEGTVEKYLSKEVWAREDQDAVAALLSRVAPRVNVRRHNYCVTLTFQSLD